MEVPKAPTGWGLGEVSPFPVRMESGEGAVPLPEIFYFIFSFKMVHFDAFWSSTFYTNCVTMMFMISTVTFSSCTCSTVQQKGRPRNFCADFSGGGVNPRNLPPNTGLLRYLFVDNDISSTVN